MIVVTFMWDNAIAWCRLVEPARDRVQSAFHTASSYGAALVYHTWLYNYAMSSCGLVKCICNIIANLALADNDLGIDQTTSHGV